MSHGDAHAIMRFPKLTYGNSQEIGSGKLLTREQIITEM
ncbi:MAG: hypothetical protein SRB1_01494 [Desulfobacteraceae bacterium Eth-SRB1]|nr:MAG: hypothetical protein SRB1_01494 [Desulfobacteraceae bacterium Eth-SRB1]